jgi:hypothetical protein
VNKNYLIYLKDQSFLGHNLSNDDLEMIDDIFDDKNGCMKMITSRDVFDIKMKYPNFSSCLYIIEIDVDYYFHTYTKVDN